jgi:glycosyltransferase involved in cell wall biosynthesis
LCYCGAIGAQYRLPDMLDIALRLKRKIQYLRFYILSPAVDHIGRTLAAKGLQAGWIYCQSVPAADVPKELARCNLGIALREPTFSTQAVLPVKLGEYLLAGLPIIGTPGVGNTSQLEAEGVFRSAEADDLDGTIRWIVDEVRPRQAQMRRRSHEAGMRYFSLEQTVEHYARALEACSALYRR